MPCRSDYMEPTEREREASKVAALLDFVETGVLDLYHFDGHHPLVYNTLEKKFDLDASTANLCQLCKLTEPEIMDEQPTDLQLWWHNHRLADRRRAENGR